MAMLSGMQIASLYAKIGVDTKELDQGLRGSDKALRSFGKLSGSVGGTVAKGMATLGVAVGAAMAATAAAVTVTGFKFNNLSQQGQIAFETMLGSADKAKKFLGELQTFAAKTPFEYASLMQASQKMLAMGFKENDILPTLTAIGDAVAGLGGGQEKIDRVTIALGQMKAKGKASAEEMMQLTEAGIPAWEMLAQKIGVSIPEAMKMVTKGSVDADTAIAAVVAGMNTKFGGMMAKQATTFGGLWSTIMDTFSVMSGKVTQPLFEAMTRGFGWIVDVTNKPAFTAGVEKLVGWVGQVTARAESMVQVLGPRIWPALRGLAAWAGEMSSKSMGMAKALGERLGPALRGVIGFARSIPSAWSKFREIADNVNDPGLHKMLGRLRTGFAGLGKVLGNLARPFKDAFSGLFKSLMVARGSGWSGVFDVLVTRLMTAVSKFGSALTNDAIPFVLGKLKELGGVIKGWFASVDWSKSLTDWAGAFTEWAGGIWKFVQPKLAEFWNWLSSWVTDETKRQTLWDAIVKGWTAFTDWAGKVWDWVKTPLGNFWGWLTAWVTDPAKRQTLVDAVVKGWTAFTEWAGAVWDAVKTPLGEFWGWLSSWVTDPTKRQTLTDAAVKGWTAFADWAGGVWDAVKPKLGAMWTSLASWVTDPAKRKQLADKAAEAWNGFTDWAGKVWEWAKPKLNTMWVSLSSWVTDPAKRDELRNKANGIWTGFTDWAGSTWAAMKPKLDAMWAALDKWITDNVPVLTPWLDAFKGFAIDAADQWAISFPAMAADFVHLRETIETESPKIAKAFSDLWVSMFGGPDADGLGGAFVKMLTTMGSGFIRFVDLVFRQTTLLLEFLGRVNEATKALARGDSIEFWNQYTEMQSLVGRLKQMTGENIDWWLDQLPKRAAGGRSTFGGMTWVGERGPELVNLPAGSHVYTNAQSTGMAARGGRLDLYVHGESSLPADRGKIRELALMMQRELQLNGGRALAV